MPLLPPCARSVRASPALWPLAVSGLVLAAYAAEGRVAQGLGRRLLGEGLGLVMVSCGLSARSAGVAHTGVALGEGRGAEAGPGQSRAQPSPTQRSLRDASWLACTVLPAWCIGRTWWLGASLAPALRPEASWAVAIAWALWQHGVAVALPEELFWRGYLQAMLARAWPTGPNVGFWRCPAALVSCALFAASHVVGGGSPIRLATFLPGLLFAWLWRRHGSVAGPWALHTTCNLVALAAERLMPLPGP